MLKKGVKVQNEKIEEWNTRVCNLLADAVGVDLAPDPSEWWQWWQDYNQMTEEPKEYQYRYYYERKTANILIAPPPRTRTESSQGSSCECLVAGTPVWTDRGFVAVDEVKIGDLVLAKDPEKGRLAYDPVRDVEIDSEIGLLQWSVMAREGKPELVRCVAEYFERRREDE